MDKERKLVVLGSSHTHHGASGQVVKDPVCGMEVDPARAAGSYEYKDQRYFFCCPHCLEKFRAEPTAYLTPTVHQLALGAPSHKPQPKRVERVMHFGPIVVSSRDDAKSLSERREQ
jgi:Cu+-exporting ATPase